MPARTLSAIIDSLGSQLLRPDGSPAFGGTLAGDIQDLLEARTHLDGLEESRALTQARAHAYERAGELLARSSPLLASVPEHLLALARFLSAGWEDLERPDTVIVDHAGNVVRVIPTGDGLGELASFEDLAASEARAVAQADALQERLDAIVLTAAKRAERIEELERILGQTNDERRAAAIARADALEAELEAFRADHVTRSSYEELIAIADRRRIALEDTEREVITLKDAAARIEEGTTIVALWGETFGRMKTEDAERLTAAFQEELNKRSAAGQVAAEGRATAEARIGVLEADLELERGRTTALKAEIDRLRNADVDLVTAATITNLEEDARKAETRATALEGTLEAIRVAADGVEERETGSADAGITTILRILEDGPSITPAAKPNPELALIQHLLGILPGVELPNVDDVDTSNILGMVGSRVGADAGITVMRPVAGELDADDALVFAAWIVAMADNGRGRFAAILRKVAQ